MLFVGNEMTTTLYPNSLEEAMKMIQDNRDWNTFQLIGNNINMMGMANGNNIEWKKGGE